MAKRKSVKKTTTKKKNSTKSKKVPVKKKTTKKVAKKTETIKPIISIPKFVKLDPYSLAYSLAILGGICILIVSILGKLGFYAEKIKLLQMAIPFYSLTLSGIIIGIATVGIYGLIFGVLLAWLYNKLA